MAWTSIHGVEFRGTAAYVSTGANDVVLDTGGSPGALVSYPQSKSVHGDTFNVGWSTGSGSDGGRDRSLAVDVRLAGMSYLIGGTGVFRMQAGTAAGSYKVWAGFSDQTNGSGVGTFSLADANGTIISSTGLGSLAASGVYDINGNLYASAALGAAAADSAGVAYTFVTSDTTNGNGGPLLELTVVNTPLAYFAVQYLGAADSSGLAWIRA
jgi:hypothetical protein